MTIALHLTDPAFTNPEMPPIVRPMPFNFGLAEVRDDDTGMHMTVLVLDTPYGRQIYYLGDELCLALGQALIERAGGLKIVKSMDEVPPLPQANGLHAN